MDDQNKIAEQAQDDIDRRSLMGRFGATAATVMAVGAAVTSGAALTSRPAEAQGITDFDILNFALNLEYVEAQYYIRAFLGRGLDPSDTNDPNGVGNAGFVLGGAAVPFKTESIAAYAQKITVDEVNHVRFLRRVLGNNAVAQPNIDLLNSFNGLALAAGLVPNANTQFNPFADEISFLLGAFVFEDVGVTAYAGAAALLQNKDYLSAAASILAIEAYHSGTVRTVLGALGQQKAADAISAVRAKLGNGKEQGITVGNLRFNTSPSDTDSLAFRRTTTEVLNIVYAGRITGGGFLPNQANGVIR